MDDILDKRKSIVMKLIDGYATDNVLTRLEASKCLDKMWSEKR